MRAMRPSGLRATESLSSANGGRAQQVFETLEVARHVAVDERDPHARVDRKPAVLLAEHVGSRSGVEELRASEPEDQAAPHPLRGDRGSANDRTKAAAKAVAPR